MRHKSEVQNNQSCTGIVRSSVASVVARATARRSCILPDADAITCGQITEAERGYSVLALPK